MDKIKLARSSLHIFILSGWLAFIASPADASNFKALSEGIYQPQDTSCDIVVSRKKNGIELSYIQHGSEKDPFPCNGASYVILVKCKDLARSCEIPRTARYEKMKLTIVSKDRFTLKTWSEAALLYKRIN